MVINLGTRLKMLRTQKKLTQEQVAERIGTSKAVISSYEVASRYPSYNMLIKLAVLYGVTTDYLLGLDTRTMLDISDLTEKEADAVKTVISCFRK